MVMIRLGLPVRLTAMLLCAVAGAVHAQAASTLYTISAASGCGLQSWTGTSASGQAVCSAVKAVAQTWQPSCNIPGTYSSATFAQNANGTGGTCTLACTNQQGENCGGTLAVTASAAPASSKDVGPGCGDDECGDPIVMSAGNKYHESDDIRMAGSSLLKFTRFYNSSSAANTAPWFGQGWTHTYASSITVLSETTVSNGTNYSISAASGCGPQTWSGAETSGQAVCNDIESVAQSWQASCSAPGTYSGAVFSGNTSGGSCALTCVNRNGGNCGGTLPVTATANTISTPNLVAVTRPDGRTLNFALNNGVWIPDADVSDTLVELTDGSTPTGWQYTVAQDDSLETYDASGNLRSITSRDGVSVNLAYASGGSAPTFPAQLSSATDSFGHTISFTYNNGLIQSVKDPAGAVYGYSYQASILTFASYPDNSSEAYDYNESAYTGGANLPSALTGVVDGGGSRYDSTWYNAAGYAVKTAASNGSGQYAIQNTFDSSGRIQSASLTDPLGTTTGRTFSSVQGRNRLASVSRPSASGSSVVSKSFVYDANGNVIQSNDFNGNPQCAAFDTARNLETARIEGIVPGAGCPSNLGGYSPPAGSTQRKILTRWHPVWHLVTQRAEPLKITTWVYNGDGGNYCAPTTATVAGRPIGVLCSVSEQATTDATGAAGFAAGASGSARVWSYTYNSFGQVLTARGPRSDVNQTAAYTYYSCTTGGQCGEVNTVTNALGQVWTFSAYNGNGQPQTITDPNGVATTLSYDALGRVKSSSTGGETTAYYYNPSGLLGAVTLADGSQILYMYDTAHRLTQILDGVGNNIQYTMDGMGNRVGERVYDVGNTLHRAHSRSISALNQVYQEINAAGTSAVTTTYGYDNNDNRTAINAPLGRSDSAAFDALNRLIQSVDPAGGTAQLGYDGQNRVTSVTDPRGLSTSYTYDGLGNLLAQSSPDSGTTSKTYDPAGNLLTATDARGAIAKYSYDALNRPTQVAYSDQTTNLGYDTGANGVGRLTSASDANHTLAWSYDALGRVTGEAQTVGTVTLNVVYGYTGGDLSSLVTPSGQTVTYSYSNHRISAISVNGTPLVSGVSYEPFGPVNGWSWGNGTTVSRSYDQDGNPQQVVTAGIADAYTVDPAFRITGIGASDLSTGDWTFGFDAMDRVTSAGNSTSSRSYTYDANGNRLASNGAQSYVETIAAASNQLTATSGAVSRVYSYDAAGNTTGYGGNTYTFNQRGRLSQATVGGSATSYVYDALGQRIVRTGAGGTTLFAYDQAGHLLGEYTGAGALIQETVWMGDLPVATLRPDGSSIDVYYVHTDHLGAPRKVTRPSDNGLVWRWDPYPFGVAAPNGNPSGLGTFTYNLRFPGQYYDTETGLFHNGFRDYDPVLGRYIEADPIGLAGGSLSTYAYVGGNPLSFVDPDGLQEVLPSPIGPIPVPVPVPGGGVKPGQPMPPFFGPIWDACISDIVACAMNGGPVAQPVYENTVENARTIWWPEKEPGNWACKARADCNDNIPGNCPDNPWKRFAFGGGIARDLGTARNIAKGNATANLGCQPKHVSCKCTGPKGEQYSGGC